MVEAPRSPGRAAQRRRTRRAIVEATVALLQQGRDPSIAEVAAEADVSRRTVYLHFPTLDQLVLDATVGLLNAGVDDALDAVTSRDAHERLATLVNAMFETVEASLPLGRKLIKLTVDADPATKEPRRGHRRVRWLEWALLPVQDELGPGFDDLVSTLAMVIGWEALIVLADVRGLEPTASREITLRAASDLLDAALARQRP